VRILLIADPGSVHAGKFNQILKDIGHETRIFAPEVNFALDEHFHGEYIYIQRLNNLELGKKSQFDCQDRYPQFTNFFFRSKSFILRKLKKSTIESRCKIRLKQMNKVFSSWNPEFVISLKLQNEGYLYSLFLDQNAQMSSVPWIHFIWGTDLEYFGKDESIKHSHIKLILSTLSKCRFVITDTYRDATKIYEFGFKGKVLTTTLAFGGFELEKSNNLKNNIQKRRLILVKGREGGLVGKASLVVEALERVDENFLAGYEIHFVMVTKELRKGIQKLMENPNIKCIVHENVPYSKIKELMKSSLITISASTVDGSPGFLLESMAFGAVPLHSDQESVREWIKDGVNGFLFDNSQKSISQTITLALSQKVDLTSMAELNYGIVSLRANPALVQGKIQKAILDAIEESYS
jgi:glycosyltransferase involved in cell wall biosynthesis